MRIGGWSVVRASCVDVSEEIVCKCGVFISFGEEVRREVMSGMAKWSGVLEESKSG